MDRETCLCRRHKNIHLKHEKLYALGILNVSDLDVLRELCCNPDSETQNKAYMYRECNECKEKRIGFHLHDRDQNEPTYWFKWQTVGFPTKENDQSVIKQGKSEGFVS